MIDPGSSALLPAQRRARVVELLRERGTVRVDDLATELDVSTITVRRDIAQLTEEGLVRRLRGGAALSQGSRVDVASSQTGEDGSLRQLTFGMVVPSLDYYWPDVIRGARAAAATASIRIELRGVTYEARDERGQLMRLVKSSGVDGLLVAPTTTGPEGEELIRWLQTLDTPVVLMERTATVGPYQEAMESVVSDHALGAGMAVRHLAALGHRRIGLATTLGSPTSPHLRSGWRRACEELGLVLDGTPEVQTADRRSPSWQAELDNLLDHCLASSTGALLVHADLEAISLVERCQERGIRIPDDLAIVTYDDEVAALSDPPLTAIRPSKTEIGRAAVALLAARLRDEDGPERPVYRIVVGPRLVVRSST